MVVKRCAKCGTEKPTTEFYAKEGTRLSGKCKPCHMDDVRAYRSTHLEYYRQIDKRRAMRPHRVSARAKWATAHPERFNARLVVQSAVKSGYLLKLPCAICGSEKTEGHHPDYSAPLDVVWLCSAHHKQAHALVKGSRGVSVQ